MDKYIIIIFPLQQHLAFLKDLLLVFLLFFLIAIYISRGLKSYDHKYTLQYHLCRGRLMNINYR